VTAPVHPRLLGHVSEGYADGLYYAEGGRRRMASYAEGISTPTTILTVFLEACYADDTHIWPST
jgi:hypothetical protein